MSEDFDGKMHDGELEEQGLRLSVTAFLFLKNKYFIQEITCSSISSLLSYYNILEQVSYSA